MAYSPLSQEIEDLIVQRLLREDVPTRRRMVEAALDVYSRTSSVLALLHGQPVAFYHESSGRAFTLTGVRMELQECRLVPMPRVRTLDRKLENHGEAPPQHGIRGPLPTSYSRYESSRPSVSRRDSNPGTYEWTRRRPSTSGHCDSGHRHDDRYGDGSSSYYSSTPRPADDSYYYSETRGPAGTSSSRSTFYTTNGGPASSSGYYPSGHDHSGFSSHYDHPHSHGPSSYYTDTRAPGGSSGGHHHDDHHHSSDPRGGDPTYTEYATYATYTRAPRTDPPTGHHHTSRPRSPPPANATEAETMEWQLTAPYGFYQIMGVPRDASDARIRAEFRRLAVAHHPDRHPEADRAEARRRFQALAEANECLSNGVRRESEGLL
ncbi:hypothetical protein SLS58_010194 [Diplodia intermedia]|uniref:J domain-containing protein n=1 Tax=Diplodia intermedia TaxID=856260 RepID=A0ABR3T7G5_9PEZI